MNPPCHELLRPEEFQLFLCRFLGEYVADIYQVSSGKDKRIEGIDLFLGQPLARMMLQASLSEIAVQTHSTSLGKGFELRPDFIGTPERVYSGLWLSDNTFLLHINDY